LDYRGLVKKKRVFFTDFRVNFLNALVKTISDEYFVVRSRSQDGRNGFTRDRKITFTHLIVLITQGLSRSIQRELNSFYQKILGGDFSLQHVTKGAFTQARAKLKPEAFLELNKVGLETFYRDAPYKTWQGFRLLAIDGSTIVLPNHITVAQEFGVKNYGPYADSPRSMARTSLLYDVLNLTTLDGQIASYDSSERAMAEQHFESIVPQTDLTIFDRGYPSLPLMYRMQQKGIHYCIRMVDSRWTAVKEMVASGAKDKQVTFTLKETDEQTGTAKLRYIKCRLVVVDLPGGEKEILCTSVLSKKRLPYECFTTLYHFRWNIEEGYKLFKSRLQLEAFSGKTALAVKQDFFAKIFMMTTTAVLAFPVEEKIKEEEIKQENQRKYPSQVNRTHAIAVVKEMCVNIFIRAIIEPAISAFDKILLKTKELIRKNRTYTRKKITKKPPSMNYKHL
jgi:Transposase DDE domain